VGRRQRLGADLDAAPVARARRRRPALCAHAPQSQAVRHHEHAREAHREAGEHRVERHAPDRVEHARRERDEQDVVDERPEEVRANRAHRAARDLERVQQSGKVAARERHVGRLDGDVGARGDRDTNFGLRERGCVVDAVADESDTFTALLEFSNDATFVFGANFGEDVLGIHTGLLGDNRGGRLVVARDQVEPDARAAQTSGSSLSSNVPAGNSSKSCPVA